MAQAPPADSTSGAEQGYGGQYSTQAYQAYYNGQAGYDAGAYAGYSYDPAAYAAYYGTAAASYSTATAGASHGQASYAQVAGKPSSPSAPQPPPPPPADEPPPLPPGTDASADRATDRAADASSAKAAGDGAGAGSGAAEGSTSGAVTAVPPPAPPPGDPPPQGGADRQAQASAPSGNSTTPKPTPPTAPYPYSQPQQQSLAGYDPNAYAAYYQQYYQQHPYYAQHYHTSAWQQQHQQYDYGSRQSWGSAAGTAATPPGTSVPPSTSAAAGAASTHSNAANPTGASAAPPHAPAGFSIKPQFSKKHAQQQQQQQQHQQHQQHQQPAAFVSAAPPPGTGPSSLAATQPAPSTPSHSTPAAAAPSTAAAPRKFPPAFQAWVERCFARCRSNADRQATTQLLTAKVKDMEARGRMWLMDWDREPVPSPNDTGTDAAPPPEPSPRGLGSDGRPKRSRWSQDYDRVDSDDEDGMAGSPAGARGGGVRGRGGRRGGRHGRGDHLSKKAKRAQARASATAADEHGARMSALSASERSKLNDRAGRFGDGRAVGGLQSWQRRGPGTEHGPGYGSTHDGGWDEDGWDDGAAGGARIVGTNRALEKSYFRLTAAPDPSSVRPEAVLQQALARLNHLLATPGGPSWFYACDQFKGMRQDCTVQHLRNETAAQVYEAHGRAALEYGDLAEFNQCQTRLRVMYSEGVDGCVSEFTAYKILYETVHQHHPGLGRALLHTMRTALADPSVACAPAVAHALRVRAAVMTSDVAAFFRLYATAPALGRALMDLSAEKLRWAAANTAVKAFKTPIPLDFLAASLGFRAAPGGDGGEPQPPPPTTPLPGCRMSVYVGKATAASEDAAAVAACAEWLAAHGAVVVDGDGGSPPLLDVKASVGKLVMPEEEKVSHGDENLSLGDFLSAAARASASATF